MAISIVTDVVINIIITICWVTPVLSISSLLAWLIFTQAWKIITVILISWRKWKLQPLNTLLEPYRFLESISNSGTSSDRSPSYPQGKYESQLPPEKLTPRPLRGGNPESSASTSDSTSLSYSPFHWHPPHPHLFFLVLLGPLFMTS